MVAEDGPERGDDHLQGAVDAWWVSVLKGGPGRRHPRQPRLDARLNGETLVVSGAVANSGELRDVQREARHYCQDAVQRIDFEVSVEPQNCGKAGLLRQVLFAAFEDREQAAFAGRLLEDRLRLTDTKAVVVQSVQEMCDSPLPQAYAADVERYLRGGCTVLVIEADETNAFRIREALDEDTRSLETVVTPPQAEQGADESSSGEDDSEH